MFTIYVYVLDTLADWEIGYVNSELNSRRFFKKDANRVSLKTVSYSKEPIKTMGGMTIVPDCVIDDIVMSETSVLLLPGADTWNNLEHKAIIKKASELLALNATVAAICGATVALANHGLLDNRPHTSNGAGFLEMFSSSYKGQNSYINELSVWDNNLITASSAGALLWAKQIIAHLDVFESNTLESWYAYFNTGDPKHFYALMESLPDNNDH
ncbi:type 1 glutamine amidotransferase family protein [Listeria innocua]|uniref:Lin0465 protein n=1 Tax=Listeria innocua serovar 6a (strain ATCC BAA-680 / CLIP 11262) TaxID=272626 RepID=Q92EJ4_LISIN|nr:type 1 glutamine amidotransferase family protein [Listeria innocua]EEQ0537415.1 glutamine amidotransferase [Listeria innocua]EIF5872290.1 glutamine amidotransferase [Listeria innocua]EKG5241515.1 glutamine amidotransferase [Listeria innocua]EKG5259919.1 glutamine amidotransferase [Listeria innocua]CAC95697.1 lin0465 [Listeria innocua Clip11262]